MRVSTDKEYADYVVWAISKMHLPDTILLPHFE